MRISPTLEAALTFEPLPIDDEVARHFANLVASLRASGRRMDVQDAWIAATALTADASVASRDDDFADVPGLEVISV
jgi:predicted nucleic acid-binding protein